MQEVYSDSLIGVHPEIDLTIRRVEPSVWYSLGFHKHHYLTEDLNKACVCFLFEWGDKPVAFAGIIPSGSATTHNLRRVSRLVILPDYQGLGLSTRILNFLGGIVASTKYEGENNILTIKTINDKIGLALERSDKWKASPTDKKVDKNKPLHNDTFDSKGNFRRRMNRESYCKRYCGEIIYGYEDLFDKIEGLREESKYSGLKNKGFVFGKK